MSAALKVKFIQYALEYASKGLSIIPIIGKKPALPSWTKNQMTPMPDHEIRKRFSSPGITGLAVVLGQVSGGLCCRDFDSVEAYETWAAKHPNYASMLPTVQTGRGRHVHFRAKELKTRNLGDGELRGEGSYCLLPPSRHPDGPIYKWLREPSGEIPTIDPDAAGLSQTWTIDTDTQSIQRDRGTEIQRDRGNRGTDVVVGEQNEHFCDKNGNSTHAIRSIEDVVRVSIPRQSHVNHHHLFTLARAMLALQAYLRDQGELGPCEKLSLNCLQKAFDLWYGQAEPHLRPQQTKDEYRMEFLEAWEDVRIPLGEGALDQILEAARRASPPEVVLRNQLSDPRIVLLVKFCRELQRVNGEGPFYLSVRTVQQLFGLASPRTAHGWLKALQVLGILRLVEKGGPEPPKATRFRYLPPLDDGATNLPSNAEPGIRRVAGRRKQLFEGKLSGSVEPTM